MKFKYQAKTKEGELQVGFVEGDTRDTAVRVLAAHDLFITSIEEAEHPHWYDPVVSFLSRVKSQDMVIFTRQFSVLLSSRLPLNKALSILQVQTTNATLKEAIFEIGEDVNAGLTLYQSLERQRGIFSDFFISMIRSAEVTGNLDEVAGFLADYTEHESKLVGRAKSALIYPAIVIGLFATVVFIMLTVVFPQVRPVFEQAGVTLPWFSQALVNLGSFLSSWWYLVLGGLAAIVVLIINYANSSEGRAVFDDYKIKLPLIKRVFLPITLARFSNATSMLVKGGVPIAQAMEIVGETVDNVAYRDIFHEIAERIRQGQALSDSIAAYPDYFPEMVSQMVAVGEKSGQLNEILGRVANFYIQESESTMGNLVELIQPILMILIGGLVGLLFGSVLIPLYKLTSSIQ